MNNITPLPFIFKKINELNKFKKSEHKNYGTTSIFLGNLITKKEQHEFLKVYYENRMKRIPSIFTRVYDIFIHEQKQLIKTLESFQTSRTLSIINNNLFEVAHFYFTGIGIAWHNWVGPFIKRQPIAESIRTMLSYGIFPITWTAIYDYEFEVFNGECLCKVDHMHKLFENSGLNYTFCHINHENEWIIKKSEWVSIPPVEINTKTLSIYDTKIDRQITMRLSTPLRLKTLERNGYVHVLFYVWGDRCTQKLSNLVQKQQGMCITYTP